MVQGRVVALLSSWVTGRRKNGQRAASQPPTYLPSQSPRGTMCPCVGPQVNAGWQAPAAMNQPCPRPHPQHTPRHVQGSSSPARPRLLQ